MIAAIAMLVAHLCGAGSLWSGDTIALDTLVAIESGDTVKIKGPVRVIATNPVAGILVRGVLQVAGDDSNRVSIEGGKGIEIAKGASAFVAGLDLSNTANGLFVNNGEATVWDSRLTARAGRPAAILSGGELVVVRSLMSGNAPLLVGWSGNLELDDVVMRSDTLWRLSPKVAARFQDVEVFGKVRIGQDPPLLNTHAAPPGPSFHLRWMAAPDFGTRAAQDKYRQDVATFPVFVSVALGDRFAASLLAGWRSGWLDNKSIFEERDQTVVKFQYRIVPNVELGIEGGYGGSEISWDRKKADLALGLVDRGMDLEEPFAAPGPLAGGRIRLLGKTANLERDAGIGYQWRGTTGSTDLGDLLEAWFAIADVRGGTRTGLATSALWCLPDRDAGQDGPDRWQWTARFDHRQDLSNLEWGAESAFEGRDDETLGQRGYADLLWGGRRFRIGPALGELVSFSGNTWSAAAGPGGRLRLHPSASWSFDLAGFIRAHRSAHDGIWIGGDLSAKVAGGF